MSRREFKAVVLDLFDTLVRWEPERLPLIEFRGRQVRTTMPWVFPKLAERLGGAFDLDGFIDVYGSVVDEINAEREYNGSEITCNERFERALRRYFQADDYEVRTLAEELTRAHMSQVRAVTSAPPGRIDAVRRIAPHYRLALLSNFDDARCGREVLLDTGVAELFEAVIISAEVGLRKPNPQIFRRMLAMLRLAPHEVLFVGDTPRDDVLGASQVGIPTAWISRGRAIPDGIPAPHFTISDLAELPAILEV